MTLLEHRRGRGFAAAPAPTDLAGLYAGGYLSRTAPATEELSAYDGSKGLTVAVGTKLSWANPFAAGALEAAGTVAVVMETPRGSPTASVESFLASLGGTGSLSLYRAATSTQTMAYYSPTLRRVRNLSATFVANTPMAIVGRWNNGASGTVDQDTWGITNTQLAFNETGATGWTHLEIIGNQGSYPYYVRSYVISATRKADLWTTTLQAMIASDRADPMKLFSVMDIGDVLIPMTSDGYLYTKLKNL